VIVAGCPVCSVLHAPHPRVVHVDLHVRVWGPRVTVIFAACVVLEYSSGVYIPFVPLPPLRAENIDSPPLSTNVCDEAGALDGSRWSNVGELRKHDQTMEPPEDGNYST
jgi:hypothetical protein